MATAEVIPADGKDKKRPPSPSPCHTAGKEAAAQAKATGREPRRPSLPAENRDKPTPPSIQTDLLSGLLEEDLMSALPSTDPLSALAAGQGPLQQVAPPRSKTKGDLGKLLKSPWLWVGLAGAGLLVLLLVLVIVFSSSSTQTPGGHPVKEASVPAPMPNAGAPPPPAPAQGTQAPSPSRLSLPHSAADTRKTPPSAAAPKPPQTSVEKNPPAPKPVEPAPPATPPTPPATEVKPPEPATPPPEKPIDTDELLAGLKTISVHLTNPIVPNPKSYLNSVITTQVKGAARQVGLELVEKDPNVMEVELKVANAKDCDQRGAVGRAEVSRPRMEKSSRCGRRASRSFPAIRTK